MKEILWPTYENKQHALVKYRNQKSRKQNLPILKSLVCDEIQRRDIEKRMGWARVEKLC
jgi:hypothetical protein